MTSLTASPFLVTLGEALIWATRIYVWLIIIRVLLTWISPNPHSPFILFLNKLVDPVLNLGRRLCPFTLGGLDFTPVLIIIVLQFGGYLIGNWLYHLGMGASAFVILPLAVLGLLTVLYSLAWILFLVMLVRLIMGLVQPSPYNPIVQIVYALTEPLLAPMRRFFPPGPKGLDWRALVFLVAIYLIQNVVLGPLANMVEAWRVMFVGG